MKKYVELIPGVIISPAYCSCCSIYRMPSACSYFPWFILGFLALALINSLGVIPQKLSANAKAISKFLMVAALVAIGLNTNFYVMYLLGFWEIFI